jgi:hypothetical protein
MQPQRGQGATRETDGEIADVDHLLHFAEAFGQDLASLDGDQSA